MVQLLNRPAIAFLLALSVSCGTAQSNPGEYNSIDYKDRKSHENFRKRRKAVAAWQINQLKKGALVVRLKTNQYSISALQKSGQDVQAEKLRIEQAAINVNMIKAFTNHYRFSKVYFVYSGSSDSLLKGVRSGIFLDTTLQINPSIKMTEEFYLIAESDFVYSSSIGFVPQSEAPKVTEHGTPSSFEYPIVFKNKFGHQLKRPFPVNTDKFTLQENEVEVVITVYGVPLSFGVNSVKKDNKGNSEADQEKVPHKYIYKGQEIKLRIPKDRTYAVLSDHVANMNAELRAFYQYNSEFSESSKNYYDSKPFFY